jgi:hypothetical protein
MPRWLGTLTVVVITIIMGGSFQLLFWRTKSRSVLEALAHNYGLWFLYFVASAFLAERLFRLMNNRSRPPRK